MDKATAKKLLSFNGSQFCSILAMSSKERQTKAQAKREGHEIVSYTHYSARIWGKIHTSTDPYLNAVERTSGTSAENFKKTETYYEHDETYYSLAYHKEDSSRAYLVIHPTGSETVWELDGKIVEFSVVEPLLQPSYVKKLQATTTYNVTNDVTHAVKLRALGLDNIIEMNANHVSHKA